MRRFAVLPILALALAGCGRPDAVLRTLERLRPILTPDRTDRTDRTDRSETPRPDPRCACRCPRAAAPGPTSSPASLPAVAPASLPALLPPGAGSPAAVEGLRRIAEELRRRGGAR